VLGLLGCCTINTAFGQATIPSNVINGAVDFIGSSNDSALVFKTDNIQRGVVDPGGNWNINGSGTSFSGGSAIFNVGAAGSTGTLGYFNNSSIIANAVAVFGVAAEPTTGNHVYAVVGNITSGAGYAVGVSGSSTNGSNQTGGRAYGVKGQAGEASDGYNYGVYGKFTGSTNNEGAGVFGGDCNAQDSLVGGCYAGYFAGKISVRSTVAEKYGAATWNVLSDRRLKKNITPFKDGLDILRQINPVNYEFSGVAGLPTNEPQIGVIAQDVERVAPYCVGRSNVVLKTSTEAAKFSGDILHTIKLGDSGTAYVASVRNYCPDGLFYVLINSVKQLDSTVTALRNQINANNQGQTVNGVTVPLESTVGNSTPVLYQNNPNPFGTNGTKITYYLPEGTEGATIVFYDSYGNKMKEVQLSQTGMGTLNIPADKLANGVYSYSLVINGQIVDTKKMILTK